MPRMDLRPVVDHIKVATWIDLDGNQVGVHAGATLEEIDAPSSAHNGFDLDHSPIFCMGINPFRHCLAEVQPESLSNQGFSKIPKLLATGKKVAVWDFSL